MKYSYGDDIFFDVDKKYWGGVHPLYS